MSSQTPASMNAAASPSFWQVMPMAPACDLHGGDRRDLVGLDVRAVAAAGARDHVLHPGDVALDAVEVDRHDRRVEVGDEDRRRFTGDIHWRHLGS